MVLWVAVGMARASDVDLFEPAASFASGLGTPQGEAPEVLAPGFVGGVLGSYARDPVTRTFEGFPSEAAVEVLAPVTVQAGWTTGRPPGSSGAPGRTMRFDVLFPVYPLVEAPITGTSGPVVGDLRLQATIPIAEGNVAAALIPRVGLPTGTPDSVVSSSPWESLTLAMGGRTGYAGYVVNVGVTVAQNRPLEVDGVVLGSSARGLLGVWLGTERIRIGGEVDLDVGLAEPERQHLASSAHGFLQGVSPAGVGLAAGAGGGLLAGIGSPAYRVFAALTYTSLIRDADEDWIVDRSDACATVAEDADGFEDEDGCPDFDNDADDRLDAVDRCPDLAEDRDGFDDDDGCPDPDNDSDGVRDEEDLCRAVRGSLVYQGCPDTDGDELPDPDDACPADAGPASMFGCPDRDGDRIPDGQDPCPTEAGDGDGCPKAAYVEDGEIKITERVEFELGRSTIRAGSLSTLDGVARVLLANPGVRKVEVQGHTDDVGSPHANQRLSQARAEAVVGYLVAQGVERERLASRGYGETAPLFSNRTPKGRDSNRRVQFLIREGAAEPPPPPVMPEPPPEVVEEPAPNELGPPGSLTVKIGGGYWATIYVDGRKLQRAAPFENLPISAGKHRIRAENSRVQLGWEIEVDVGPGQEIRIIVPAP